MITAYPSTTCYLKLPSLTLAECEHHGLVRCIVVNNGSRDGGDELLDRSAVRIDRLHVEHDRRWLGHGPGMRCGVRGLDCIGRDWAVPSNLQLFSDSDVVFHAADVLAVLVGAAIRHDATLPGEMRQVNAQPDVQAKSPAVSRDAHDRRDVASPFATALPPTGCGEPSPTPALPFK